MGHEQDQQQIGAARHRQGNDRGIDHRHPKQPHGAETHEPVQIMGRVPALGRLYRLPDGLMFCG